MAGRRTHMLGLQDIDPAKSTHPAWQSSCVSEPLSPEIWEKAWKECEANSPLIHPFYEILSYSEWKRRMRRERGGS